MSYMTHMNTRTTKEEIWHPLHRLWSKAVGTEGYVKREWQDLETQIVRRLRGEGTHPEVLPREGTRQLVHNLWGKAKEAPDYSKAEWDAFELLVKGLYA